MPQITIGSLVRVKGIDNLPTGRVVAIHKLTKYSKPVVLIRFSSCPNVNDCKPICFNSSFGSYHFSEWYYDQLEWRGCF